MSCATVSKARRLRRADPMAFLQRALFPTMAFALPTLLVACIDVPSFGVSNEGPSPVATGVDGRGALPVASEHAGMVLVPATSVVSGVTPTGQPGNGKGKGKDKEDKNPPQADSGAAPSVDSGAEATPPPSSPGVIVPSFWLDVHEVTVEAYRACLGAGACTAPDIAPGCTLSEGLSSHPVNCVTADQARAFCTWASKRLVRSEEWTAAAAGDLRRPFPWGVESPSADRLNACGLECGAVAMYAASDGHVQTAPVGSFPAGSTPEGVADLAGNVAEWVEGSLMSTVRGGSYEDVDPSRVSSTNVRSTDAASPTVGFRCAEDR
jgi:formylglycine-generating enzyme required for sulfatase activity